MVHASVGTTYKKSIWARALVFRQNPERRPESRLRFGKKVKLIELIKIEGFLTLNVASNMGTSFISFEAGL